MEITCANENLFANCNPVPSPSSGRGISCRTNLISRTKKRIRGRQDSNLRGQSPLDFKSNTLTTRSRPLPSMVGTFRQNTCKNLIRDTVVALALTTSLSVAADRR
jgi:hypothetical protein